MKNLIIIMLFLAVSCGTTQIKEKILKKEAQQESIDNKQKGAINFDGVTPDNIVITSSGNGAINVNTTPKQRTTLTETKNSSFSGDSKSSFSVDYWIESTPMGTKLLILVVTLLILWTIIYFLQRTLIGRATQEAGAGVLKMTAKMVDSLKDQLIVTNIDSPEHSRISSQLRMVQAEREALLAKQKAEKI